MKQFFIVLATLLTLQYAAFTPAPSHAAIDLGKILQFDKKKLEDKNVEKAYDKMQQIKNSQPVQITQYLIAAFALLVLVIGLAFIIWMMTRH